MSARSAAPVPLPTDLISPTTLDRLRREGIASCEAWLALKGRRLLIFGVPPAAVREVDAAVRAALEGQAP